jgi:lipoprotein NlpI
MRMYARRLLTFAFIQLASAVAFEAIADDAETCARASGENAITACSRVIASGALTGKALALAYSNRGVEWQARGQFAKAIADHNAAVQADPRLATVYNNRGIAYAAAADYDRAIADYNQAIKLDSNYAAALNNRGLAYVRTRRG